MEDSARYRPVHAVERAVDILRYLGRRGAPARAAHIAAELDIIPSTCLHIVRTLTRSGLVDFDPSTKHYRLGLGILEIARQRLAQDRFIDLVQPELDRISATHHVTLVGVQPDRRGHMVAVAISRARQQMSIHVDIGSKFPSLISATGRCFAAHWNLEPGELRRRFAQLQWQNPPSFEAWCEEIRGARENGFAVDRENYLRGITIVAVCVLRAPREPVAGISAIGLSDQVHSKVIDAVVADLKTTAARLGTALSG